MTSVFKGGNTDYLIRSAIANVSKFFSHGWGNPDLLRRVGEFHNTVLDRRKMIREVYKTLESTEIKLSKGKKLNSSMTLYNGEFISPLTKFIPKALPSESEKVNFQIVLPNKWKDKKPMCVHLAGTGDHFFWRRRHFMASPLGKEHKIGSIILENPFYGHRKPKNQVGSAVNHVSDIFVMGAALLVETVTLLLWCQRKGFGPLGVTGISMGGHMASVAASGWFEPMAIIPCLSWSSAAPCFTDGVLSHTINWKVLETQLQEQPEYLNLVRDDHEFRKSLAVHYKSSSSFKEVEQVHEELALTESSDSRYNQIYSTVSSLVSNLKPLSYIDSQSRRLSSMVVEADLWKYMDSISKQLPDPTAAYKRFNVEMFKDMTWSQSNFEPSPETLDFMTSIMDQGTHLSRFNIPHKDSSIIYVAAEHDRYMPRECYLMTPQDIWKQTEVRMIDSGHVFAILQHQNDFRDAIKDSFQLLGCTS